MASLDNPFYAYRVAGSGDADWTIVEVTDGSFPESFTGTSDTEYEVKTKIWSESAFATTGSGSFDSDYQAVLDYATAQGYTLPSPAQQTLQNQLVIDLKNAGIWAKLDTFAVFATDGNANFALVDWVRLVTMTSVNSPTYTSNLGFTTDGISSYINTEFLPSSGANSSTNSCSFGFLWDLPTTAGGQITGVRDSFSSNLSYIVDRETAKINSDAFSVNLPTNNTSGFWHINRKNAATIERYINGILQGSALDNSEGRPNFQFTLGCLNNAGSFLTFDPHPFRIWFHASDLSTEAADFYTAIQTYITQI